MRIKFPKFIIRYIAIAFLCYFLVAFVLWQWNVAKMTESQRGAIAVEFIIFSIINALGKEVKSTL